MPTALPAANAVLNSGPPIHPATSLLFSTYYSSPTDTSIKIILRIALSGDPEESLQPRLQDTVGDCYNKPCHWFQGTLPPPHLRPQTDDSRPSLFCESFNKTFSGPFSGTAIPRSTISSQRSSWSSRQRRERFHPIARDDNLLPSKCCCNSSLKLQSKL